MQRNVSRAASALCPVDAVSRLQGPNTRQFAASPQDKLQTSTPIKHVVVIFGGRTYRSTIIFGTYPTATNPPGEPAFTAAGQSHRLLSMDSPMLC